MSVAAWIWVIYVSAGLFIMMEALVESWRWDDFPKWVKIVGGTISVLLWPLMFFMD